MQLTLISDTHGYHRHLQLPAGDVLIHAGDITARGSKAEVVDFLDWLEGLDYQHKIFIGGNHDFYLEEEEEALRRLLPGGITYLNESGIVLDGLQYWGSPVSPDLLNWAFGRQRASLEPHWAAMPADVDILITHTPPLGILDQSSSQRSLGCAALRQRVDELPPRYHVFGHIHASYGRIAANGTTFFNASIMDTRLGPVNAPFSATL